MSVVEKMTVHKALCELKVIGDRIEKTMGSIPFVFANEHMNTKIRGIDKDAYIKEIESAHQSAVDLIRRREAIKRAVVNSNAVTKVMVCDTEFTVAEAIEMKNHGLEFYKSMVYKMTNEHRQASLAAEVANGKNLETRADGYIRNLYGATDMKNLTAEAVDERDKFIKQHTTEVIDPLNALEKVRQMEEFIYRFSNEVDAALSVSNAITEIEISY